MKRTKLNKTLDALKNAPYGIHSFDLMKVAGTTRVAARINDLKKMGYSISSKRETLHGVEGCRYKLENHTPVTQKKAIRYELYTDELGEERMRPVYL